MSIAKRISKIVIILGISFAFGSGVASAEYLGPDRVKTEIVSEACQYGVWAHKASDTGETCVDANGNETEGCTDCTWECDPGSPCGIAKYYYSLGTKIVEHSVTVTYPEATIGSITNCTVWGDAGWCVQLSSVTITANEPVAGKEITLIEGTHNSGPFACAADTCTVNMVEGSNALSYWALSSFGDSTRMGNLTVLQDTIAPVIDASVTGTMGENGWFVSNAILSVVFSDATPGSGLVMTQALFNGVSTDVSSPVTITDGVYDIQLSTRDAAGWEAHGGGMIYVDTTAPVITANQPAVEVSNSDVTGGGYMNGNVLFTGTYSDPTSGVRVMEVSPDGSHWYAVTLNADGTWTYDWDSSQATDGSYTPLVYAIDNAGNRTDITMQPITLDNSAPGMSMTGGWYIWESGHIEVVDYRVGIGHIELSVRDDQDRWPAREWNYDTDKLVKDLQWDRKFGDGTTAPTGSYEVLLQAWDKLGNGRWITSRIYIPEAGATAEIPLQGIVSAGTVEETPTPMAEQTETEENGIAPVVPAAPAATDPAPTAILQPSSTPSSLNISSAPIIPESGKSKSTSLPVDPNLLTGAAALAAAASATAYSLQKKAEMDAEIKRREERSRAEAMAKVRAAEATKVSNYLQKLMNDEKEKWLNDLRETEGKTYFDLTDEEKETLRKTNIGAYIAVGEYFNEVGQQSAELGRLIASTGGRAITDLSDEQLDEFLDQGLGAKIVVGNYLAPQIKEAKETAEQNAEWSRIIASTGGRAITDLSKEQQDQFLEQGNGAILAANNYYSPLIAEAKRTAEQNAEWSRIIASTGGRVITDLSDEQRTEFLDQGNGAKMAAGNYFAPLQAAYERYMAEKAYSDKMNRVEQETKDRNVISEVPETIPYYPMNGGYTQEELQAMVAANLDRYAELEGKPTIDEKIQKNPIYQWFAPRLAIYNSITETAKDLWHETEFYKLVKSKVDWAVDKYKGLWNTMETAWKITTNKNSTYLQKLGANIFLGITIASHFLLAVGLVLLAIATLQSPIFIAADFADNAKTLITAPIQYAAGELTIGELGFQVIVSSLDLELPGGKKAGDLIGNSALEMGLRNIDDAMDVVNPSKIAGNLDELGDTLDLFYDYGKPAAQLLDSVDVTDARKLLDNLDVWDVDNLLKLDSSVIKSIAELDDVAIKGLSGKVDVIIDLGDDAIKQVNQHGMGIIPFLNNYTDEGLQLINSSDEAAEFVLKHWDDAPEKVALAVDYGKPAMQLLDSVDATGARKLLDNLNAADIDSVIKLESSTIEILSKMEPDKLAHLSNNYEKIVQLGPNADHLLKSVDTKSFAGFVDKLDDVSLANVSNLSEGAVVALSKWEGKDLVSYGSELIARAEKDANIFNALDALKQIKKDTGSIDFDNVEVKKLINEIADNSIQDGSGRFALGKWAGRDGGYIGLGRNNGYIFYESPGGFGPAVNDAVGNQKNDLFWAINQKVIQEQIGAGATFEYTLNGISKFELDKEKEIIKLIWQGKTGDEIIDIMKIDTYPSRYKELEELYKAKYSINEVSNSYILRK